MIFMKISCVFPSLEFFGHTSLISLEVSETNTFSTRTTHSAKFSNHELHLRLVEGQSRSK